MPETLPVVLIPGLNCSARLYAEQIPALWRFGPVQVADHTRDDSMDVIASRILAAAPSRFALAGLSMGGYLALTIMRHAPERVQKLALLDTRRGPKRRSRPRGASRRSRSPRPADSPRCRHSSFQYSSIATGKATKRCLSACA
jgi:pimeloyl-ACP methyl ester carboxylesterase